MGLVSVAAGAITIVAAAVGVAAIMVGAAAGVIESMLARSKPVRLPLRMGKIEIPNHGLRPVRKPQESRQESKLSRFVGAPASSSAGVEFDNESRISEVTRSFRKGQLYIIKSLNGMAIPSG